MRPDMLAGEVLTRGSRKGGPMVRWSGGPVPKHYRPSALAWKEQGGGCMVEGGG
jgi:hypothetical protein